jgi:hypothetical protein
MDAILKSQAEQRAREMATQVTTLDDLNGLMRAMMKTALERMLNTELDVHLGRRTEPAATTTPNAPTTNVSENASAAPKNRRDQSQLRGGFAHVLSDDAIEPYHQKGQREFTGQRRCRHGLPRAGGADEE